MIITFDNLIEIPRDEEFEGIVRERILEGDQFTIQIAQEENGITYFNYGWGENYYSIQHVTPGDLQAVVTPSVIYVTSSFWDDFYDPEDPCSDEVESFTCYEEWREWKNKLKAQLEKKASINQKVEEYRKRLEDETLSI